MKNPTGIMFGSGPNGSGQTTTLDAAINAIRSRRINIPTIEDPVEIPGPGVMLRRINPRIDLNSATMLRAFLRQDADVIMVGEIRDTETAKIATEAALTGHLVFATLRTTTTPQAIVRLMEVGVEAYVVAPTITGVLPPLLAARIGETCKEASCPPREVLLRYFTAEGLTEAPFFRGRGCAHCRETGDRGHVSFHELVVITEEIRQLIFDRQSVQEITCAPTEDGYRPLRYDGLNKVRLGLTTIAEIEENGSFDLTA